MAYKSFVSDDQFIRSPKFKSLLYKKKGKAIRESVIDITPSNENQILSKLKMDVKNEMKNMTPERGRKLLEESHVMIFPSLDLNSALFFYSFLHDNGAKHKLNPKGVIEVYTRSSYNPDANSLMIWGLYPPHKKSVIIDTKKEFGHVMTLKLGEVDPMVTADIGINVTKLNKAQIQKLIKERAMYNMNN